MLRDVGGAVEPGTVIEVTGRNGAGKSTLLRVLAGVLQPSKGGVSGRPAAVGYAPEVFPAGQPFTVSGYLRHMAAIRRAPFPGDLVERLGAAHLLTTPLRDLSKGSGQKVGIIQALLGSPGLLILDEPFAGLDAQTRTELPRVVGDVAAGGGRVVISDHQNQLAGFPGARHWLVADGQIRLEPAEPEPVRRAVIEVRVDPAEADEAEQKLRAGGYDARRIS